MIFSTATLLILAAASPQIIALDDYRFRVLIVFDDKSPIGHMNAQFALILAAKKNCKRRGVAVSEGTLELNDAKPIRKGKAALELGEIYRCVPKH